MTAVLWVVIAHKKMYFVTQVEWRIQNLISKVHLSDSSESSQALVVDDTVGDDTGNITCTAENTVGRVYTSLRLIVDGIYDAKNKNFSTFVFVICSQTISYF